MTIFKSSGLETALIYHYEVISLQVTELREKTACLLKVGQMLDVRTALTEKPICGRTDKELAHGLFPEKVKLQ